MEAGVARRGLTLMCYYLGDFAGARTHCEKALAACDPERDEETRQRSGEDIRTLVTACLAGTTWQLGEVERARELIDEANPRATELGHAPSMAHPLVRRGDAAAADREDHLAGQAHSSAAASADPSGHPGKVISLIERRMTGGLLSHGCRQGSAIEQSWMLKKRHARRHSLARRLRYDKNRSPHYQRLSRQRPRDPAVT